MSTDKIILYSDKKKCCGCGACMQICPTNAISMKEDKAGFIYPVIDERKCIKCHLCEKSCAFQKNEEMPTLGETYIAQINNQEILQKSSSGGAFSAFAISVLNDGGIVFGAAYYRDKQGLKVRHIGIERIEDLSKLQGSKYVQSDTGFTYQQVLQNLTEGRKVLYSGTPCQIAGLKGFLKKDYENLVLVDLVCHGCPNARMFSDYIRALEREKRAEITSCCFRSKEEGWGCYKGSIEYKTKGKCKRKYIQPGESSYYSLFLNGIVQRESCYECKYASNKRPGDMTIGDFWGIEKVHKDLYERNKEKFSKGISGVLINTQRGKEFWESTKKSMDAYLSHFENFALNNVQLNHPIPMPKNRGKYLAILEENNYIKYHRQFNLNINKAKVIHKIGCLLPQKVKKGIIKIK